MSLPTQSQSTRRGAGDFIDGQFRLPTSSDGELAPPSPAHLADVPFAAPWSRAHVDVAVGAARGAGAAWRKTAPEERARLLRAYAAEVNKRAPELTEAIARSIGKPTWEAKTEVDAMVAKIEITLDAGAKLLEFPVNAGPEAKLRLRPIGVCAVLGPFNFPGHLANGHIVPALATGNTVVYKPSERAPEVGELMAACIRDAGFPRGVFNLVQGGPSVAEALVAHRDVDGVMFTGSTHVGKNILRTSSEYPGRLIALELGGRNPALVHDDADLDYAAAEIAYAAYITAGQRCTANSRALVQASVFDAFVEKVATIARAIKVGAPHASDVFMGPVITAASRDRALALVRESAAGFEAVVPLAQLDASAVGGYEGHYLSPSVYVHRGGESPLRLDEVFAPILTVERVSNDEEAIARANEGEYGLAAAVFTRDIARFERVGPEIETGLCNWNRSTVGSSSKMPFGGRKASGNHRPAGLWSTFYCVDAIAELRVAATPAPKKIPGFPAQV